MGKKIQQQRKKKLKYTGKFNCCTLRVAPEQKARATYEKLIDLCKDDPDVVNVLRYLREREVVHFQRFGEALNGVQEKLAQKRFYMNNVDKAMDRKNEFIIKNNIARSTPGMNWGTCKD